MLDSDCPHLFIKRLFSLFSLIITLKKSFASNLLKKLSNWALRSLPGALWPLKPLRVLEIANVQRRTCKRFFGFFSDSLSSDFAEDPAKCSQIVWMLATLWPVLRTPIVLEARCTPIRLRAPADRFAVCALDFFSLSTFGWHTLCHSHWIPIIGFTLDSTCSLLSPTGLLSPSAFHYPDTPCVSYTVSITVRASFTAPLLDAHRLALMS